MTRYLTIAALALPTLALAVPMEFTHQARVLDADGVPINGPQDITISLYDTAGGDTPVWFETQDVTVEDGYLSLRLGTDPEHPLDTSSVIDGGDLWVGITVGNAAELPVRTKVASTPYALRSAVSTSVDGGPVVATTVDADAVAVSGVTTASAVQVGDPGATCTAAEAGRVRYAGGLFQGCDGAGNWIDLGQQDTNTPPSGGDGIVVSGGTVSRDSATVSMERRIARYQATCAAHARHNYPSYSTVAAVTPGSSAVTLTGNQVCGAYVGNNSVSNFSCISVPFVYNNVNSSVGNYFGTDVRPGWSSCASVRGPSNPSTGNYPWVDPVARTGVMMACCIAP